MLDAKNFVKIKPIPSPSHVGLKITSRSTSSKYKCEYPPRSTVSKENYDRRKFQLQQCGYQSSINKPYQEVGELILDSKELILKTLHQNESSECYKNEDGSSDEEDIINKLEREEEDLSYQPPMLSIDKKRLSTIEKEVKLQKSLLNRVKQGVRMNSILQERLENKKNQLKKEETQKKRKEKENANPPISDLDDDTDEEKERDLSRFIVQLPKSSSNTNATNNSNQQQRSSSTTTISTVAVSEDDNCNKNDSLIEINVKKKQFKKKDKPRPYSPIYTNINFYADTSNDALFRQLCVINWILEAMSQDNNPPVMMFVTSSWKLNNIQQDEKTMQKRLDREKLADPIWNAFITNPQKFQSQSQRRTQQQVAMRRRGSVRASLPTSSIFANKYIDTTTDEMASTKSESFSRKSSLLLKESSNEKNLRQTVRFAEVNNMKQEEASRNNWQKLQASYKTENYSVSDVVTMKMNAERKHRTSKQLSNFSNEMKEKFSDIQKQQDIIMHDRLESRDRSRWAHYEKKFVSLRVVNHLYKDMENWRKRTGEGENNSKDISQENLITCQWYETLLEKLSTTVQQDGKINIILKKILRFVQLEGRKVSVAHFLRSLALLRPFELCHPDISAAIEFVRDEVVSMDKHTFEYWCKKHVNKQNRISSAPPALAR